MVEMPGIREPERMRKLLQGSANLEFWETYTAKRLLLILPNLTSVWLMARQRQKLLTLQRLKLQGQKPTRQQRMLSYSYSKEECCARRGCTDSCNEEDASIILNVTDYPW